MKKMLPAIAILVIASFISCQDEILRPQNLPSETAQSTTSLKSTDSHGLVNPSEIKQRITPLNGVAYSMATYVPEEIYIAKNNALWAVVATTGSSYALNPDMPDMNVMTSINGKVYGVLNDNLYEINVVTGVFTILGSGWTGTEALVGLKRGFYYYLYAIQGGTLWRVDLSNNNVRTSLSTGWAGTEAMVWNSGTNLLTVQLFIAKGDNLYKYTIPAFGNPTTSLVESGGWNGGGFGTKLTMVYINNNIYSVRGSNLWRTGLNGGSVNVTGALGGTIGMTQYSNVLYNVSGFSVGWLQSVNPSNGTKVLISTTWSGTLSMTGLYN